MKTLLLVVGCHRSGTSATAGALARLGVDFGPEETMLPPNPGNPRGYYEQVRIMRAHDALLAANRNRWDAPHDLPWGWATGIAFSAAVSRLRLTLRDYTGDLLGVKDPRATLFLELWQEVARREHAELVAVGVRRTRQHVLASLMDRERWSELEAVRVYDRYMKELTRWRSFELPYAELCYEEMLADWVPVLAPVLGEIGICRSPSSDQIAAVDAFLSEDLNRHAR